MIDLDKIDKIMKPLNERINDIKKRFGDEVLEDLLDRIEISLDTFLNDFKEISSKSFSNYWNDQKKIKNERKNIEKTLDNNNALDENIPKFISDYKNNDKK